MEESKIIEEEKEDMVNHPKHYVSGRKGYESIDVIENAMSREAFIGFLKGNALKYINRCEFKGSMKQDIEKAIWYLSKMLEVLTKS